MTTTGSQELLTPTTSVPKVAGEPARSGRWQSTREAFIAQYPRCAVCAETVVRAPGTLNVHHVVPFDFVIRAGRADLELDVRNLITLCEAGENHHLVVGHLGDWGSYNAAVRGDAGREGCHGATEEQIRRLAWWVEEREKRPKRVGRMTEGEVGALRAALDTAYPRAGTPTQPAAHGESARG